MKKIMVMLPTYNEAENIERISKAIFKYVPKAELVFVDDNSPDGTPKVVEKLAKKNSKIHLLLRMDQKGRGYAGRDGFVYCLEKKADIIIEMDADLSHNPKYIPKMIDLLKENDVVLGSRFVKGATDTERSIFRKISTIAAVGYIKLFLGIAIQDPNSGFRAYTKEAMRSITPKKLFSSDADIVQEVLYKLILKKNKIVEIPIIFEERKFGETTKNFADYVRGLWIVLKLRFLAMIGRL